MSRKGNCYDNCIMETFFGRLKNEMYYGYEKDYTSFEEFSKAVEEYIEYYNNKRIQAKTKWMPPVQYRIASMCSAQFINMCPGFWVHIKTTTFYISIMKIHHTKNSYPKTYHQYNNLHWVCPSLTHGI